MDHTESLVSLSQRDRLQKKNIKTVIFGTRGKKEKKKKKGRPMGSENGFGEEGMIRREGGCRE